MNSDLEELRELGSGTFGTVYHGKWRGTDVAIKRINDRCFSGKPLDQERMVRLFIILVNRDLFYSCLWEYSNYYFVLSEIILSYYTIILENLIRGMIFGMRPSS